MCSDEAGMTRRTNHAASQVATRRRAKNGELREVVAMTKSGKGHGPPYKELISGQRTRAMASRQKYLDKHNARLGEQIARVECIDNELKQLRIIIAGLSLGPSRRSLRQERDALLAERELMCMT